jgi:branched-chain amino acid transport system permease protein
MFIAVVMFAPGGIAGLLMMHQPPWRAGTLHWLAVPYAIMLVTGLITAVGAILVIEMTYRLMAKASEGSAMTLFRVEFDAGTAWPWIVALALLIGGCVLCRLVWPLVARAWDQGPNALPGGSA